ncbi:MAG: SDR family oxidoreductase [Acidimicrobiales bacterium]|nr:SDR family oxidoreductase [Acidimicrobiales bacterium]
MIDDREFEGQVALVTGAAGIGIGQACARRLAAGGAAVVVTDSHERRTREVTASIAADHPSARVVGYVLDMGLRDEIDRVVSAVAEQLGPIRLVVNNAAVNWAGPIWDYDVEHFDRTMAVNLAGPWYLCRQTMPMMRDAGGGSVLNSSSGAANSGGRFGVEGVYAMTKGGLETMTDALAADGGPYGIRVNTLSTGIVYPTKFIVDHPDQYDRGLPNTLLGSYPTPAEVAEAAVFLLSDRAAHISGARLKL